MTDPMQTEREALKPCPFCGEAPSTLERPDNIDGTEFFYAVACYCGGYSSCAHKMARRKTPEQAKADAIAAWNNRAESSALTLAKARIAELEEANLNMRQWAEANGLNAAAVQVWRQA
jgi:Lar family restriction alleviation protein